MEAATIDYVQTLLQRAGTVSAAAPAAGSAAAAAAAGGAGAMQGLKQQDYFRPCAFAGFTGVVFPGIFDAEWRYIFGTMHGASHRVVNLLLS